MSKQLLQWTSSAFTSPLLKVDGGPCVTYPVDIELLKKILLYLFNDDVLTNIPESLSSSWQPCFVYSGLQVQICPGTMSHSFPLISWRM